MTKDTLNGARGFLEAGKFEMNARHHRYDARMEQVLEMFESDRATYDVLPAKIKSEAGIYLEFRDQYRAAVTAGAVSDDRSGPSAA